MPEDKNKENNNEEIDTIIGSEALDDLHEKYMVSGSEESSDLSAQNNSKIDTPFLTDQSSSEGPGSNSFPDATTLPNFDFSEIQLEIDKLDSVLKNIREPDSETLNESVSNEPVDEQGKINNKSNPKKPADDYLSNMRIIYEAPEESFNDVPKAIQTAKVSISKPTGTAEISASQKAAQPGNSVQPSSLSGLMRNNINESSNKSKNKPKVATGSLADLLPDKVEGSDKLKPEGSFKRFLKSVFPGKGDSIFEIIRKTILIISLITILICCALLLKTYIVEPYQNDLQSQKEIGLKINSQAVDEWSAVKGKYPGVVFPPGMQLKFAELFVINNDFAGWLEIQGVGIDRPIVHAEDNLVYLKKTFEGEKSKYGCCFVDCDNNIAELDRNTIIYGHNMRSGDQIFGDLENYKEIKGFQAAPLITFNTLFKDTKWKIYSVFITNSNESDDNGYIFNYIFKNLSSDEYFNTYINQLDQRKLYTTGVDILPSDKILTLSTCCYDFDDARLVVVARMVRDGESENVDTSKAVLNSNTRYPQAWYTAKKVTNPYKDAEKWFAG